MPLRSIVCAAGLLLPLLVSGQATSEAQPKEPGAARYYDLVGYVSGEAPEAVPLQLVDYRLLRQEYALPAQQQQADGRRDVRLCLVSFDDHAAIVGVLAQSRSKTWTWVKRYTIKRGLEADKELGIDKILADRAAVIGGVRSGMSVAEVIALKGRHYRVNNHQDLGSADLVYDDVKVSVREWSPEAQSGRVVSVEKTPEKMKQAQIPNAHDPPGPGAAGSTFIFVPGGPAATDKPQDLYKDQEFRIATVGYGHAEAPETPGFYVSGMQNRHWVNVKKVSLRGSVLGRSPTFQECRAAGRNPPSVGWDFRPLAGQAYVDFPLQSGGVLFFPDKIERNEEKGQLLLRFNVGWKIPGVETVLVLSLSDLRRAVDQK